MLSVALLNSPSTGNVQAATGINRQINFQGKLVNPNGTNVTDGSYSIVFSIYSVASAGSAIWTETQTVTVTTGIFQVNLGSVTALPGSVDFNTDNIYLGIKVGADAEMTPRVQFTSVPQSFNSEKLGGLDKTGFIQNTTTQQAASNFNISGAGVVGTSLTTPTLQSGAGAALAITGNAASIWSTTAGNLTLQAGSGVVSLGSSTTLTATGALSIAPSTNLSLTATGTLALSALGANSITLATNGSTRMTIDSAGNVVVPGDFNTGNEYTRSLTRTVPTTVGNEVDLGTFTLSNGGGNLQINLTVPSSAFSLAKTYNIPVAYNGTAGAWQFVQPIADTGAFSGNDVTLEISITNGSASLRLRRSSGTTAGTAYIVLTQRGIATDAWTASTATSAVATPTVTYSSAVLSQSGGAATVTGNLVVSGNVSQTVGSTVSAGTGYKINGAAAAAGTYLRGDGTNFVSGTIQASDLPSGSSSYIQAQASTPGTAQNTNFNIGTGTGIAATYNATTGINTGAGSGTTRLTAAGVLQNVTGYTQSSGNSVFNQNAADTLTITSGTNAPTTDQAVITNTGAAAGNNTASVNNLNLQFKGATTSAVENGSLRVDLTPGTFSGSTTNGIRVVLSAAPATGTTGNGFKLDAVTTGGAGTYNGLLLNGLGTLGSGTETAINIQSNWDSALTVGANVILNGSGILQPYALNGNYTNLTGTGALNSGSITSGFGAINNGASGYTTTGAVSTGTLAVSSNATVGGTINSSNSRTIDYTSITGASNDWFPLFIISDSTNGTVLVNLKSYAHSSVSFTVGKGYLTSNASRINILNATISTNGGYANVTGIRVLQDGTVEARFTWSTGPTVNISAQIIGTSGTPTPIASLATSVSASPVVDTVSTLSNGLIRSGGNIDLQGVLQTAGTTRLTNTGVLQNVTNADAGTFFTGGTLSVDRGGTGANTFTTNGLIYGNGTGALSVSAAGTSGQVLVANGSGVPTFVSFSGDVTVAAGGAVTIANNAVTSAKIFDGTIVGADIANSTVANANLVNNSLTVTPGTGLSGGGSVALGASTTLNLANTAVSPGTYGSASAIPTFTVDAQGRLTSASSTAVAACTTCVQLQASTPGAAQTGHINVTGTILAGTLTGTHTGNGAGLTNLNASNLATGTVPSGVVAGSYTGITGTGALSVGSITSGFGAISTGNNIATSATLQGATVNATSALQIAGNTVLTMPSNNPERGPWNPIWNTIGSTKPLYFDEEFAAGNNSVAVYNNSGGAAVTITRETGQVGVPNSTAAWLKVSYDGVNPVSPNYGGVILAINPAANKTYAQRFRAKLPVGKVLNINENSQGTNSTSYWLTNNVGTGKWEDYIRVSHAGNTGTFSVGGHLSVSGGTGAFDWYIASMNVYEVNVPLYASANTWLATQSFTAAGTGIAVTNNATIGGTLGVTGNTSLSTVSTSGIATIGAVGAASNDTVVCRNGSNQLATCNSTFATTGSLAGYVQLQGATPGSAQTGHINITGTILAGTLTGTHTGNGAGLTSLNASNLASGTVPNAVVSGSYTGITGTGALNAGSITSGFGAINNGASGYTTTGAVSTGTLAVTSSATIGTTLVVTGAATVNGGILVGAGKGISYNSNYKTYESTYNVNTATPATLLDDTGAAYSVTKSYRVRATITATGTATGATAIFYGDGTNFTLYKTYEAGTSSNHIEFYLNAGVPTVRLYAHATLYSVSVLTDETINKGRTFGPEINLYGDSSGNINVTSGALQTGGTQRLSNAGALSSITGYAQSSGNFLQSGAGTFGTGTGAVSLNGATSISSTLGVTGNTSLSTVSTSGIATIGAVGAASNDTVVCRNGSNQLATCNSTFATTASLGSYVQLQGATPGSAQTGHINITGTILAGTLTGTHTGNGAGLTSLNASNLASGTVPSGVVSGAYGNITGVGTLGSLTVSGAINTNTFNGNTLTFGNNAAASTIQSGTNQNLNVYANGTGSLNLDTTGAGTILLGTNATSITLGGGSSAETVNLGNSTGVDTVNIANNTGANIINIGTNAASASTTIAGSTNSGSSVKLQGGSSNILVNNSGVAVTGVLTTSAAISTRQNNVRNYLNVYSWGTTTPSTTGTLEIILPNTWNNTMLRFGISGYDYSSNAAWQAVVSGYNYATTPGWNNTSAEIRGNPAPFTSIRLAYDTVAGKNVLLLGTTSTVWAYPQFVIDEVTAGYANQDTWATGYSSAFLSSEANITNAVSPTTQQIAYQSSTFLQNGNSFGTTANLGTNDAQSLALRTGGTTRLTINTSGDAVLTGKLTVSSTANSIFGNGTTGGLQIGDGTLTKTSGSGFTFNSSVSASAGFQISGTTVVDSSRNLTNIGTISSGLINGQTISSAANFTGSLAVATTSSLNGQVTISNASTAESPAVPNQLSISNSAAPTKLLRLGYDTTNDVGVIAASQTGTAWKGLSLAPVSGNVTIGAFTTSYKFDVQGGSINTSGSIFTGGTARLDSTGNLTNIGTISSGLINGQTVSSAANFTGTLAVAGNLTQSAGTISAFTGYKINGAAAAAGTYLRGDGTNFVSGTIQASDLPSGSSSYIQAQASTPGTAQNTNFNIGTGTGIAATYNATTGINTGAGSGTTRLTAAGVLQNVTGYTQSSGNATFNQNAADQFKVISLQAPTTDQVNISNAGFPNVTDQINGQQIDYYSALANAAHQASGLRVNATNTSATAGSVTNGLRVVATGAVAGTTNGIKIDNFTSGAGGASALYLGTGWKDLLSYNGTQLISGTGIVQSAAISGSYTGITGTGALNAGSITSGFGAINNGASGYTTTGATSTGTLAVTSSATIGTTLVVTGALTASTLTSTIATGTAPLTVASTTQVANLNASYLGGFAENQISQNLRSGYQVTGGGTVSVSGSSVGWTQRFIVISNAKGASFSTTGYFDVNMPADTTVITGANTANVTVTGGKVPLGTWCALYYILPLGSTNGTVNANFRVVCYGGSSIDIPSSWLFIAGHNGDNGTVRVVNGLVLANGQTGTQGLTDNPTFPGLISATAAGTGIAVTNNATVGGTLGVTGNTTVGGTFGVTGNTTLSTLSTSGIATIGALGATNTSALVCRNSSNQLAGCSTTGTGAAFVQGGNSFGAAADLGTNDNNVLNLRTNGVTRLTVDTSGNATLTGSLTVSGRTNTFSNFRPEYRWKFGGGTDLNWKKIADVTIAGSNIYAGAAFQVDILDTGTNLGSSSNGAPLRYYVSALRSSGTQDVPDSGTVAGPISDYVRLVRTALGVYELQVRETTNYRHIEVTSRLISDNGSLTVTYVDNPVDGSTTGTNYMPSTTGYTQELPNVDINGNLIMNNTTVITSARVLQNVTTDASILTTGTVNTARITGSYTGITGVGALSVGSISNTFGNIDIGSSIFTGNGSGLNTLNGTNISSGTVANARLVGSGALTVTAGTGLSGGGSVALGASTTLNLANTAVSPGTYGSASAIPTFTVDAQGRLTSASSTAVAACTTCVQLQASTPGAAQTGHINVTGTIISGSSTTDTLTVNTSANISGTLNVVGDISGNSKIAFRTNDTWLRLNPTNAFTAGIYAGTGILRTDGNLQVGSVGATLNVTSGGSFAYNTNTLFANTSGLVGIGTATPNTELDVAGVISKAQNSTRVYKNVYTYNISSPTQTGTIILAGPKGFTNTMMRFTLKGYDYSSKGAWEVVVSGYTSTTSNWVNTSTEFRGSAPFTTVRLGSDGTNIVIMLGDTSTVWQYPKVFLEEIVAGHQNVDGWGSPWSGSLVTNETTPINYSLIVTPAQSGSFLQNGNSFGTTATLGTNDANNLLLKTNNATRLTITSAGAATFSGTLAVTGATTLTGALTVGTRDASNTYTTLDGLRIGGDDTTNTLYNAAKSIVISADSGTSIGLCLVSNCTNGLNLQTATGNVGIGNSNNTYKLDVSGDINTSTQYRIGGTVICTSTGCTPASGSANYIQAQASTPGTAQNTNFNIGTGTGIAATYNATTGINTGGTLRLNSTGVLSSITGYTQSSGSATFNQNAADQLKVAALQAPTSDMFNVSNVGFPITADAVNGQQVDYYAALGNAAFQASAQRLNITNTSATAGSVTNGLRIVATGLVAGTTNGIKIDNFTSGAGGASALYLGTGWKDLLSYNGTQLISGTGIVQSAAISGSYTGITGTGALNAGSITSGFGNINNGASGYTTTGAVSTGTMTASGLIQGTGGLTITGTTQINATGAGTTTIGSTNAGAILLQTNSTLTLSSNSGGSISTGSAALTVTAPNFSVDINGAVNGKNYPLPDTGATAQWTKVGTYTATQAGHTFKLKGYVHTGYNAVNSQDVEVNISFKTSNGSSVDANGFAANSSWYAIGDNASVAAGNIKWKSNAAGVAATSYDLYMYLPTFTTNSNYHVDIDSGASWSNSGATGQTDPGAASSTVLLPANSYNILNTNVGIGNVSPGYKLDVTGDINTSSNIRSGGTIRLDSTGNLTNIGTLTTSGIATVGTLGATNSSNLLCRNSSNQLAGCNTTGNGAAFVQGGNSFGAAAVLGTNDGNILQFKTNGTVRLTIDTVGNANFTGALISKANNASGYSTQNTSNLYAGQWTRIASCNLSSQYLDCRAQAAIVSAGDSGSLNRTILDIRVKQQNALGGVPYVNLELSSESNTISTSDIKAVTVQNDATATVVEVYGRVAGTYQTWQTSPFVNTGTNQFIWYEAQAYSASLPAGTQTAPTFSGIQATAATISGSLTAGAGSVSLATNSVAITGTNPSFSLGGNTIAFAQATSAGSYSTSAAVNDLVIRNANASGNIILQQGAGAAQLFIQGSNGNVGIGNAAPTYKLDVSGSIRSNDEIFSVLGAGVGQFRAISGNYGALIRNDGADTYLLLTASGSPYGGFNSLRPLRINDATGDVILGNSALYARHAGQVGVNNNNPTYQLDVGGTIRTTGALIANANGAPYLYGGDDSTINDVNVANTAGIIGVQDATKGCVQLGNNGGAYVCGSGANVGVGTATPGNKFEVQGGNAYVSGNITAGGTGFYGPTGLAVQANDAWLRLNQNASFTNGLYVPGRGIDVTGDLRVNTSIQIGGGGSGGAGTIVIDSSRNLPSTGNITFYGANPTLTASSYIQLPGGLYVSGGTAYFNNNAQFRSGIANDTATTLNIYGGTSGYVNLTGSLQIGSTTQPSAKLDVVGGDIAFHYGYGLKAIDNTYNNILTTGYDSGSSQDYTYLYTAGTSAPNASAKIALLSGGNVGIGTTSPLVKLDVAGTLHVNGSTFANSQGAYIGWNRASGTGETDFVNHKGGGAGGFYFENYDGTTYDRLARIDSAGTFHSKSNVYTNAPDYAETILASDDSAAQDVVIADPNNSERVIKSSTPYSGAVVGIVSSGGAGVLIDHPEYYKTYTDSVNGNGGVPLAVAGRVPVHVTDENGPIKPGDYLTSSSTPGYAMKATHAGATIGKSYGFFDGAKGSVLALVNIGYYNPYDGNNIQSKTVTTDLLQINDNANIDGSAMIAGALSVGGIANVGGLQVNGSASISSDLTVGGRATISGSLDVAGPTTVADITINGHIITAGSAPTFTMLTAAGLNATVTITGNDTSGTITITTGDAAVAANGSNPGSPGPLAGAMAKIMFAKAYTAVPHILIAPSDASTAGVAVYPGDRANDSFTLGLKSAPTPNTTYSFEYFISQ